MNAIRGLIKRYPLAAIAIVAFAAGFSGWTIYQWRQIEQAAVHVLPEPAPVATPPAAPSTSSSVTPAAPAGQAPLPGTTSPPGGPTAPPTSSGLGTAVRSSGKGRANPFKPLAGTLSPGSAPPGTKAISPVPPLPPAGTPSSAAPPAVPVPVYKIVGLLWSDQAVAILEDGGGSYVVAPGDIVEPDIRILTIDVQREVVRLDRGGMPVELSLVPLRRVP